MNKILHIAAYRFVTLSTAQLAEWRGLFKVQAQLYGLKGTILLSSEGINLFLAGGSENIAEFKNFLSTFPQTANLSFRETGSEKQPYKRLLVKIKKEIISMGEPEIQPEKNAAEYLEPSTLKEWLQQKRSVVILDTRNQYEVEKGTFKEAINLGLKNFRSFPRAAKQLPDEMKQMPIVTFCTGGIRCEKAALWLKKQGYQEVYQLQGGILNYFEQCGREYFQGECFVFDERVMI